MALCHGHEAFPRLVMALCRRHGAVPRLVRTPRPNSPNNIWRIREPVWLRAIFSLDKMPDFPGKTPDDVRRIERRSGHRLKIDDG